MPASLRNFVTSRWEMAPLGTHLTRGIDNNALAIAVIRDRYAGEFPRELFRKRAIEYRRSETPKSNLYRDMLPLIKRGDPIAKVRAACESNLRP